jgi:hypothetical protein
MRSRIHRLLNPRLAAAALLVLAAAGYPPPIPSPQRVDEALRNLPLTPEPGGGRLGRGRFPLSFPVDRSHGEWKSGTDYRLVVHGHGASRRRYGSVSLELLFWELAHFEADLRSTGEAIDRLGFAPAAREVVFGALRGLRQRLVSGPHDGPPFADPRSAQVRIGEALAAPGLHIPIEGRLSRGPGGDGGYVIVQLTDAEAPQAAWPAPADVEALFPFSRRRMRDSGADIPAVDEPEVFDLSCRRAGADAFRCRYVVSVSDWLRGAAPRDRYSDLFRRRDGRWALIAPDAGALD